MAMNLIQKVIIATLLFLLAGLSFANNELTADSTGDRLNLKCSESSCLTKSIILSTFKKYPLSLTVSEIMKSAYKKIGLAVEIHYLPGKRALIYSNSGHSDGELFRIEGIENNYHNLIRIPVALIELETIAFARRNDIVIQGWPSLKPYKIGYLRGFKKAEKNTQGMKVHLADQMSSLFKLLVNGSVDLIVESRIGGGYSLAPYAHFGIRPIEPPIDKFKIYHYLHKSNKSLIPRLTETLQEMKTSGDVKKIVEEMIQRKFEPL
ncbi:MAG: hypothetical protein OFPI_18380 [Osedax symbiont Rs2]|nr:MAG: hypothetical protein OFPI_18380 [Osedax symbiont Rs2]